MQTPCIGGGRDGEDYACGCVNLCRCEGFGYTSYLIKSEWATDEWYVRRGEVFVLEKLYRRVPTAEEREVFFEMSRRHEVIVEGLPNA